MGLGNDQGLCKVKKATTTKRVNHGSRCYMGVVCHVYFCVYQELSTKYMISKKQPANIVKPVLQIDGINIESVDHFLGINLDSRIR